MNESQNSPFESPIFKCFESLFQNAKIGMLVEDRTGLILDVNPTYCNFMGYTREELIGQSIHKLAPEDQEEEVDENIRRIIAGESMHHLVWAEGKDGERRYLELYETRIPPDGQAGFVVLVNDLTDRKRVETLDAALEQVNAELVSRNSQLRNTVADLREREEIMNSELVLAQEVQQHFLPMSFPFERDLQFASHYKSHSKVGGDLYDVFALNNHTVAIVMADVSGHGVSAALMTAFLKSAIQRVRHQQNGALAKTDILLPEIEKQLLDFLNDLNRVVLETIREGSFITFFFGLLNVTSGHMVIINAGHQPPICWRKLDKAACEVQLPTNIPLGVNDEFAYEVSRLELMRGDKLVLYTDGFTDQQNPSGEMYDTANLLQTINENGALHPDELLKNLIQHHESFSQNTIADDDQTLLVLEYKD